MAGAPGATMLAVLRTSALLVLASNAGLYQAIQLHQRGDFAGAEKKLSQLWTDPTLSDDDRVTAAEYLASCELSLDRRDAAKAVLKRMLRDHPNAHLDPEVFFPEVIALAEQARI